MAYRILPVSQLPSIDAARTLVDACGPLHRFLTAHRRWILLSFLLGLVPLCIYPLVHPSSSVAAMLHWLPLMSLPCVLMVIVEARRDLVALLLGTYEFWFVEIVVVVFAIATVSYLHFYRVGIVLVYSCLCAVSTTLDAIQLKSTSEVLLVLCAVGAGSVFLTTTILGRMPDANDVVILRFPTHVLHAREVIINTVITLIIFILRSVWLYYKARAAPTGNHGQESGQPLIRIRSIGYRCNVCYVAIDKISTMGPEDSTTPPPPVEHQRYQHHKKTRMHFVQECQTYASNHVRWPALRCFITRHGQLFDAWMTMSWLLLVASFPILRVHELYAETRSTTLFAWLIPLLAFVLSLSVLLSFVGALYHSNMLLRLCRSFDVVFLSFQCTIAHLCVCDLFYWDLRYSCFIGACWCWVHWLLTLDACLPDTRTTIPLRLQWRVPVLLVLLIGAQVLLVMELLVLHKLRLQDRILLELRFTAERTMALGVVASLFGRFATLLPWSCRLLWRHWRRHSDQELLILRGSVEYDGQIAPFKSSRRVFVASK